jgi:hypothetical protein
MTREEAAAKVKELADAASAAIRMAEKLAEEHKLTFDIDTPLMFCETHFDGTWGDYQDKNWNSSNC